ncbi:MAG: hypothetical protein E7161_03495 [Firmicutes bacterium]|nr:hypothetical protein [Bacillota bacterium]
MNSWEPVSEVSLPFSRLTSLYKDEEIVNKSALIDINSIVQLGNEGSCSNNTINDMSICTNGFLAKK